MLGLYQGGSASAVMVMMKRESFLNSAKSLTSGSKYIKRKDGLFPRPQTKIILVNLFCVQVRIYIKP